MPAMSAETSHARNEDRVRRTVVTSLHVLGICDDVGSRWKKLATKLKFSKALIDNIECDQRSCHDKAWEVLDKWRQREGRDATVGNLADAFVEIGEKQIAEKLLEAVREEEKKGKLEEMEKEQSAAEDRVRSTVVTTRLLTTICEDVGPYWKDLGIRLRVSTAKIRSIQSDERNSYDKGWAVLDKWRKSQGKYATVGNLADALVKIEKKDIAEKLLGEQQKSRAEDQNDDEQNSRSRKKPNSDDNYGNAQHQAADNITSGRNREPKSEATDKTMDKIHTKILKSLRVKLVTEMDPKNVFRHMLDAHAFSKEDKDLILGKDHTEHEKCQHLLKISHLQGAKAFSSFVGALEKAHPHLASLILKSEIKEMREELDKERKEIKPSKTNLLLTKEREHSTGLERKISVSGNQNCSRCLDLTKELDDLKSKVNELELKHKEVTDRYKKEIEERNTANIKHKEETDRYTKEIKELKTANIQQKKREQELTKEKTEIEQNILLTKKEISSLKEENDLLKSRVDSNKEEYGKAKLEVVRLSEKKKQKSDKKVKRLHGEVKDWKSKYQTLKEDTALRNHDTIIIQKGRVLLPRGDDFQQSGAIRTLKRDSAKCTVVASRSSDGSGRAEDVLNHREYTTSGTDEEKDSWWCVDLGKDYLLFVTHCALRHGKKGKEKRDSILTHWELQGSNDGEEFQKINTENKREPFRDPDPFYTDTWSVEGEVAAFRYFRIFQTDRNSSSKYGIYLCAIELYGVLLKV